MAITFTGVRQGEPQVFPFASNAYGSYCKITCDASATTTDNGDTLAASVFGLSTLQGVILCSNAVDSESNPENALALTLVQPSEGTFKVVFNTAHGTPGATVPLIPLTDGTSVASYVFYALGFGRY